MRNIITSVCRAYGWAAPKVIDEMYCDSKDHHGLFYWYKDLLAQEEAAKPKK